jgi:hypothetical protein
MVRSATHAEPKHGEMTMPRRTPIGDLATRRVIARTAPDARSLSVDATTPEAAPKRIGYVRIPYVRMPGLRGGYVQIRYVRMAG